MNEEIRDGQLIHHDEYGVEYVLDEMGNKLPPMRVLPTKTRPGDWNDYDTSRGHCGLCGRLTCDGNCVK